LVACLAAISRWAI